MEKEFRETLAVMFSIIEKKGDLNILCSFFVDHKICKKNCDICPINDYSDFDDIINFLRRGI